ESHSLGKHFKCLEFACAEKVSVQIHNNQSKGLCEQWVKVCPCQMGVRASVPISLSRQANQLMSLRRRMTDRCKSQSAHVKLTLWPIVLRPSIRQTASSTSFD